MKNLGSTSGVLANPTAVLASIMFESKLNCQLSNFLILANCLTAFFRKYLFSLLARMSNLLAKENLNELQLLLNDASCPSCSLPMSMTTKSSFSGFSVIVGSTIDKIEVSKALVSTFLVVCIW